MNTVLREIRQEAGLSQAKLAAKIGRDQTFVSKYESSERCLDLLELREVCAALDFPIEKFIKRFEKVLGDADV